MKTCLTLFLWVLTSLLRSLPMAAQCAEVEEVLKDIVTKKISPKVVNKKIDTFERVTCYNLEGINEEDFILLGRGLEYSDITKNDPNTIEYNVLRMVDKNKGVACEHLFIRKKKDKRTKKFQPVPKTKVIKSY